MINVAVIGDVNGRFQQVFGKLNTLQAKHNFSACFVAGNLFGEASNEALIQGKIPISVPTYFSLGRQAFPEDVTRKLEQDSGELCENLHFLGRATTITTTDNLRVVAVGGTFSEEKNEDRTEFTPTFTSDDVKNLSGSARTDILLTSEWPSALYGGDSPTNSVKSTARDKVFADLIAKLKPKYLFSADSKYFERAPFYHPQDSAPQNHPDGDGYAITRFITIAPYGKVDKSRWIYACCLETGGEPTRSHVLPDGCEPSPLQPARASLKRPAEEEPASYSRFAPSSSDRRPNKRSRAPPPGPSECFFCFTSANFKPHLLVNIGNDAFLTLPKGPLTQADTFPELSFSAHVLIIPHVHAGALSAVQPPDYQISVTREMQRYRTALHAMLNQHSGRQLGSVTWEVSRASGVHTHWQFCPMPADPVGSGLLETAFQAQAENEGYGKFEVSQVGADEEESIDCFKVTLWAPDGQDRRLVLPLDSSFRFDLQFGRRVLARFLGLVGREHWKDCVQTDGEEAADATALKGAFEGAAEKHGFDSMGADEEAEGAAA